MNIKKIIPVSKIFLLALSLAITPTAFASEVSGNLSSNGVVTHSDTGNTTGTLTGSVTSGGGSTVTGTLGGGTSGGTNSGTVTGTVTGGSTAGSGSSSGGGVTGSVSGGTTGGGFSSGSVQNTGTTQQLATLSGNDSVLNPTTRRTGAATLAQGTVDIEPADNFEDDTSETPSDNQAINEPADTDNPGTGQLAAAGALDLGSGYWWLLLLFILIALGYYVYRQNSKKNNRFK